MPYTALLDANVLVPYTLTDILLRLSEAGFFRPLWSTEVLAETERTLAHLYPDVDNSRFHDRLTAMDLFFTDVTVTGWESLPDPDDRHVVAAAVVGGADAIITANLTDFPDPTLAAQILRDTAAARQRPEVTVADVLDQLSRSGTPRFAAQAAAALCVNLC